MGGRGGVDGRGVGKDWGRGYGAEGAERSREVRVRGVEVDC